VVPIQPSKQGLFVGDLRGAFAGDAVVSADDGYDGDPADGRACSPERWRLRVTW
jgi:hypothetical protein